MTRALVELEPQAAPKDPFATAADLLEDAIRGEVAGRKCDWAAGVVRALRKALEKSVGCKVEGLASRPALKPQH